jgi:hypothetical protein
MVSEVKKLAGDWRKGLQELLVTPRRLPRLQSEGTMHARAVQEGRLWNRQAACLALGQGITPHIPVWERYQPTDGMFSRLDFTYDAERDVYLCPNGKPLRTSEQSTMVVSGITCHTPETAAFAV